MLAQSKQAKQPQGPVTGTLPPHINSHAAATHAHAHHAAHTHGAPAAGGFQQTHAHAHAHARPGILNPSASRQGRPGQPGSTSFGAPTFAPVPKPVASRGAVSAAVPRPTPSPHMAAPVAVTPHATATLNRRRYSRDTSSCFENLVRASPIPKIVNSMFTEGGKAPQQYAPPSVSGAPHTAAAARTPTSAPTPPSATAVTTPAADQHRRHLHSHSTTPQHAAAARATNAAPTQMLATPTFARPKSKSPVGSAAPLVTPTGQNQFKRPALPLSTPRPRSQNKNRHRIADIAREQHANSPELGVAQAKQVTVTPQRDGPTAPSTSPGAAEAAEAAEAADVGEVVPGSPEHALGMQNMLSAIGTSSNATATAKAKRTPRRVVPAEAAPAGGKAAKAPAKRAEPPSSAAAGAAAVGKFGPAAAAASSEDTLGDDIDSFFDDDDEDGGQASTDSDFDGRDAGSTSARSGAAATRPRAKPARKSTNDRAAKAGKRTCGTTAADGDRAEGIVHRSSKRRKQGPKDEPRRKPGRPRTAPAGGRRFQGKAAAKQGATHSSKAASAKASKGRRVSIDILLDNPTRSKRGRISIPPLAYWKGQRIVSDAASEVDVSQICLDIGSPDQTATSTSRFNIAGEEEDCLLDFFDSPTDKEAKTKHGKQNNAAGQGTQERSSGKKVAAKLARTRVSNSREADDPDEDDQRSDSESDLSAKAADTSTDVAEDSDEPSTIDDTLGMLDTSTESTNDSIVDGDESSETNNSMARFQRGRPDLSSTIDTKVDTPLHDLSASLNSSVASYASTPGTAVPLRKPDDFSADFSVPTSRPFKFAGRSLRSSSRARDTTPAVNGKAAQPRRSSRRTVQKPTSSPDTDPDERNPSQRVKKGGKKKSTSLAAARSKKVPPSRNTESTSTSTRRKQQAKGAAAKKLQRAKPKQKVASQRKHPGASGTAALTSTPRHPTLKAPPAATAQSSKAKAAAAAAAAEDDADVDEATTDQWGVDELVLLRTAVQRALKRGVSSMGMWQQVAHEVKTRSASECCEKHLKAGEANARRKHSTKKEAEVGKGGSDDQEKEGRGPMITARAGTLKRKQEIRDVMAHQNEGHEDDFFDSTPFRASAQARYTEDPTTKSGAAIPTIAASSQSAAHVLNASMASNPDSPGLLEDINAKSADTYVGRAQRNQKMALTTRRPTKAAPKNPARSGAQEQRDADQAALLLQGPGPGQHDDDDDENEKDYYFSD